MHTEKDAQCAQCTLQLYLDATVGTTRHFDGKRISRFVKRLHLDLRPKLEAILHGLSCQTGSVEIRVSEQAGRSISKHKTKHCYSVICFGNITVSHIRNTPDQLLALRNALEAAYSLALLRLEKKRIRVWVQDVIVTPHFGADDEMVAEMF